MNASYTLVFRGALNKISRIKSLKLFIHGLNDEVISFWHGKKLYDASNSSKYYYWVKDAGHNDLIWKNEKRYWKTIINFSNNL